ncbi:MAG: S8/S53 family peptidase [Actinobacteria bacterium]|nr:S8/S53 family peptidase [Actinomycetota bacterium]
METPTVASHGTFVTSIIRQLAPEFFVSVAKARPLEKQILSPASTEPGLVVPDDVTDELHVDEALVRLMLRHSTVTATTDEGDVELAFSDDGGIQPSPFGADNELVALSFAANDSIAVLNLSLGTYACPLEGDGSQIPTTDALLTFWAGVFDSPIIAAGGNELINAFFYPGALENVKAVGATDNQGDQIVWEDDDSQPPKTVAHSGDSRTWINAKALGCDLVGVSGAEQELVAWSGSSFATAVVSALTATGPAPTKDTNDLEVFDGDTVQILVEGFTGLPNSCMIP